MWGLETFGTQEERSWEATCISFSIIMSAICPLKVSGSDLSPALFFLSCQGCPSPPSWPLKRLGSDHLDVWALPRGWGGGDQREAGYFLPPTLSTGLLCCFCAKVSQSCSVCFHLCPISLLLLPHRLPKELKCQLRMWGQKSV